MALRFPSVRRTVTPIAFAIGAVCPILSQAAVPPVDPIGVPAPLFCGVTAGGDQIPAVHMDKIIFRIIGDLQAAAAADQPALNAIPVNSRLDIKVRDNPLTVADLKGKVLTFLGALNSPVNRDAIVIDDVEYAVICRVVPAAAAE